MPMYEYKCTVCENLFERLLNFKESSEDQFCPDPDCGALCEKQVPKTSFILKGDGWTEKFYPNTGRGA